jgi:hypothetical protein
MNKKAVQTMMAFMPFMMMENNPLFEDYMNPTLRLTDKEMEELKKLRIQQIEAYNRQRLLKKGCKEFLIDGYKVIALNKKNAIRKIKNLKYIISE